MIMTDKRHFPTAENTKRDTIHVIAMLVSINVIIGSENEPHLTMLTRLFNTLVRIIRRVIIGKPFDKRKYWKRNSSYIERED